MAQQIRSSVLQLMQQKDKIEDEIKQLTEILQQNGVGMTDSLVDEEGFPKNSVDVYNVRHARHRIICLQNDHKSLMKQIENGLAGYYTAANAERPINQTPNVPMEIDPKNIQIHDTPFAKISGLIQDSPADLAGLEDNDLIVEFGSVNSNNFKDITDIASVVKHSENQVLLVKVKRSNKYFTFKIIPKKWVGRGLLGCNIVKL